MFISITELFNKAKKRDRLIRELEHTVSQTGDISLFIKHAKPLVTFLLKNVDDRAAGDALINALSHFNKTHTDIAASGAALALTEAFEALDKDYLRISNGDMKKVYTGIFAKYKTHAYQGIDRMLKKRAISPNVPHEDPNPHIERVLIECNKRDAKTHVGAGTAMLKICHENLNNLNATTIVKTVLFCKKCYAEYGRDMSVLSLPSKKDFSPDDYLRDIMQRLVMRMIERKNSRAALEAISISLKLDQSKSSLFYKNMKELQTKITKQGIPSVAPTAQPRPSV